MVEDHVDSVFVPFDPATHLGYQSFSFGHM